VDFVQEKSITHTYTLLLSSSNDVTRSWLPETADIAQPPISNSLEKYGFLGAFISRLLTGCLKIGSTVLDFGSHFVGRINIEFFNRVSQNWREKNYSDSNFALSVAAAAG
jgi:hypothetical protein